MKWKKEDLWSDSCGVVTLGCSCGNCCLGDSVVIKTASSSGGWRLRQCFRKAVLLRLISTPCRRLSRNFSDSFVEQILLSKVKCVESVALLVILRELLYQLVGELVPLDPKRAKQSSFCL